MKVIQVSRSHLTNRQRSKISENQLASQYKGRRQPASGALPVASLKGDVITDTFLFDDKTTGRKSFSVNDAAFRKHVVDAFQAKRMPVMRIRFEKTNRALFVLDEATFNRLIDAYET